MWQASALSKSRYRCAIGRSSCSLFLIISNTFSADSSSTYDPSRRRRTVQQVTSLQDEEVTGTCRSCSSRSWKPFRARFSSTRTPLTRAWRWSRENDRWQSLSSLTATSCRSFGLTRTTGVASNLRCACWTRRSFAKRSAITRFRLGRVWGISSLSFFSFFLL